MIDFKDILTAKNYVINSYFLKEVLKKNLNLNEMLLLMYFVNSEIKTLDIPVIQKEIFLSQKDILEAFNTLVLKNIIELKVHTDNAGKIEEKVSLDNFYLGMSEKINDEIKEEKKENIYEVFQRELERSLTPMEYEIINAWLDNNASEELILGALKEAVYNGVRSFRYIDKIIYEWSKKGFKTMNDVNNHLANKIKVTKQEELFDYDWLRENDEI